MNSIWPTRLVEITATAFLGSLLVNCRPTAAEVGGTGNTTSGGGGGGESAGRAGGSGGGYVIRLDASAVGNGGTGGAQTTNSTPTADANCGIQTSNTKRVPVDVLLVFDCSLSMVPTWNDFKTAVMKTISTTQDIHWGLKLYPTPGLLALCNVSEGVEVAISTNSTSAIETELTKTVPNGFTPTGRAIQTATTYLRTIADQNKRAILLATDGEPNCDSDVPTTVKAIGAAKDAGFPVYVVGVGNSVGNLDNFAQAGGTTKYYPAPSTQDLANALDSISKAVASCTFALTSTPQDINNIAVYLDKNLVPQDNSNGWSLDAGSLSVTLHGGYCAKISSGEASTVQILFGCPGYVPPPIIP